MAGPDDDLSLLTMAELVSLLGRNRQTVVRLVDSGAIPVAYVDRETGERFFTRAVLAAQQRRTGELHAEATAAETIDRATAERAGPQPVEPPADDKIATEEKAAGEEAMAAEPAATFEQI